MVDFIPQLSDVVEFPFGEHPRIQEGELPLMWLVTFIKSNVAVTANYLGLYFKRITGSVENLDIRTNIYVCDPFWTVEPEPMPPDKMTTLATNVDLKSILTSPAGWKLIPIDTFTFEANRTYTIMFEMVSQPYFLNGQVDGIVVSAAEKFDIPIIPPDYPFPESQRQAKNCFGLERPKTGYIYTYPVAVALYGEVPQTPPPVEKGIITNLTAPGYALEGEEVPITATVKNIGEVATDFYLYFFKPGHGIGRAITLEPGQSGDVTATYKMPNQDMEVTVNLTHADVTDDTKSVIVKLGTIPPEPPPPEPPPQPPIQMGGIILLIFALGIGISYLLGKGPKPR